MICVKRTPVIETLVWMSLLFGALQPCTGVAQSSAPDYAVREAFRRESLEVSDDKLQLIVPSLLTALADACRDRNNSKVKFASVEIASILGLNPSTDRTVFDRVMRAIQSLPCDRPEPCDSALCENYLPGQP